MFNFTALLGAQSTSPASQSLLELDGGVKILIGVGWDESFDVEKLKELEKHVPTLSIILLTHATPAHIAAFAHCCKHFPQFTRIPIYATTPVINLGRTLLQDLYASTPLASTIISQSALSESAYSFPTEQSGSNPNLLLQTPTAKEIETYFALIHPLKYQQPHQPLPSPFSPPLNGLTVTAYSAGHTLGGTIWHIQHGLESIVYAVDWNQAQEHILSGAAWLGSRNGAEVIEQLQRPTALVCSSRGAERVALAGGSKRRDEVLLQLIEETVQRGGTVLIPSDSSNRVLELAYLLEETWHNKKNSAPYRDTKLALASRTAGSTARYARSMMEWMRETIVKEFEEAAAQQAKLEQQNFNPRRHLRQTSKNDVRQGTPEAEHVHTPFDFRYMKLLGKKSQVERMLASPGPKVVVASDTSLEWGFSKDVLRNIANDSRNLVILTERVAPISNTKRGLGNLLWELYEARKPAADPYAGGDGEHTGSVDAQGHIITVDQAETLPLEGNEMLLYQQYQARARQIQNTFQADGTTALETSADVVDDQSSDTTESSDEDDDDVNQGKLLNTTAAISQTRNKLGLSDAELGINVLLRGRAHDFDIRGKKGRDKAFPFPTKRRRNDEFGDLIRPEDFLRAEERDDVDGEDMRGDAAKKETVVGQKRKWGDTNGTNKRTKPDGGPPGVLVTGDGSVPALDYIDRDGDDGESEDEEEETAVEGPKKVRFSQDTFQLHFRIAFVDFSGLHDKRSLQYIIPKVRPRKLILIGGETPETLALAADCRQLLGAGTGGQETGTDVFTPVVGKKVDASVDTNAWVVKLSQPFARKLKWQTVKGLGVVAVAGRLELEKTEEEEGGDSARKKLRLENDTDTVAESTNASQDLAATPVLDVVPTSMVTATRSVAQPLHVGDLRLADLRKLLQASGHTAEFRGEGILLIDGMITVRKSGTGKIDVEGGLSLHGPRQPEASFYAVRRKIYDGLALVSGG